jgi:hypothetical protein
MKNNPTRRRFIKTLGAAASAAVIVPSLFDLDRIASAAPVLRRDVAGLTASSPVIVSYRKAIKAMQALPGTNPVSWTYQAAIHGTFASGSHIAWNTCEHHTLFFWSWHRMYLHFFERIIRKQSGNSTWALPFWNYSASAAQRKIPPMFRDTSSVLFAPRKPAMNNGTGSLLSSAVSTTSGMAEVDFADASDGLESTPHDSVHVGVGGLMGQVPSAAQDPLFYLHHSNIDRLWNIWLAQGGGRKDPLGDANWRNTPYTFFDENGTQVTMTGCQVLRAAQQLNYRYEGEPAQVNQFCPIRFVPLQLQREELFRVPIPPITLRDERLSFDMDVRPFRQQLRAALARRGDQVVLEVEGVEADQPPGVIYEIYVGLPPGATPDPKGPYFVGVMALFSTGVRSATHHGEFKPARFSFRLNRALQAALKPGVDRMPVTIVPRDIEVNGRPTAGQAQSEVRVGGAVMTVKRRGRQ